jgi:hypothetical protein
MSGKKNTLRPAGEIGTLVDVAPSKIDPDGKCFLTIEHEGTSYVGCLLFDDGPFCQKISKLLQRHLRYSLEYIGGVDLRYGLDQRTLPGQHKRPHGDSQHNRAKHTRRS